MQKFLMILKKIKYYRVISLALVAVLLVIGFILKLVVSNGANKYEEQNAYKRWDPDGKYAQVSLFFKETRQLEYDDIMQMNYDLEKRLELDVVEDSQDDGKDKPANKPRNDDPARRKESVPDEEESEKRAYIECYSSKTQISLQSQRTSLTVNAYAVGGDFFYFHPVKLLSGMYFSSDDLMHDGIILDEETAWKLFGSYDIEGQQIETGDSVLFVKGVYKKEDNKIFSYARGDYDEIFIPYELASENEGGAPAITCVEVCLPNPVKNYAAGLMTELIGKSGSECIMVENSERFSVDNLWNVFKARKYRAMDNNDIIFPYWEKIARYEENILAPKTVWMCFCFIAAGTVFVCLVLYELTNLTRFKKSEDE